MDQGTASEQQHTGGSPIFGAYRRGYDPEQVDRYITAQQRRIDEANDRAEEAERKLVSAVNQLRDLHRRVAVLENDERPVVESPSIDTLGERVQRILQEAWDGSYALRQAAEREVTEMRDRMGAEAEEIIESARQKAEAIDQQIDRRRRAFVQRLEQERERARGELSFLREQRKAAVDELLQAKTLIETTVRQVTSSLPDGARGGSGALSTLRVMPTAEPEGTRSNLGPDRDLPVATPRPGARDERPPTEYGGDPVEPSAERNRPPRTTPRAAAETPSAPPKAVVHATPTVKPITGPSTPMRDAPRTPAVGPSVSVPVSGARRLPGPESAAPERVSPSRVSPDRAAPNRGAPDRASEARDRALPPTVPVHRLPLPDDVEVDVGELVRNHRAATAEASRSDGEAAEFTILEDGEPRPLKDQQPRPAVFDFDVD